MADSFPAPITAAIAAAYKIGPTFGAQVEATTEAFWGEPEAIRALSRSWTELATRVDNSGKNIKAEIRSLEQDWEGSAANAYKNWMQTLNDESIAVLSGQFNQISTILDGTADDVSAMNGELTRLCTYFVGIVGGLMLGSTKGKLAAFTAAIAFCDRLLQFQNSYIDKLHPRREALRQIATGISAGSIGKRIQHPPDPDHPFPYYTQEFADSYRWHVLGDWRKWKLSS